MKNLSQELNKNLQEKTVNAGSKPVIFDFKTESDQKYAMDLFASGKIQYVSDDYKEQQNELFAVKNPSKVYTPDFKKMFEDYYSELERECSVWQDGRWVYFPWLSSMAHIVEEEDFQLVRTARNKNLINKEEQEKFYNSTVGIGGLSVGNSVALAIVLQGGAKRIKLADLDRLALSNTNRIRVGVDNLGVLKVEMTARQIYEINPYAEVELFPDGLTQENIGGFFQGLNIVIDELDNLAVKYLIREQAKKHRIAVVMAADNGDNAVVDIERYDLDQNTPFFQGRMGEVSYEMLSKLDKFGIGRMITKHVGPENVTERMQQSLLEMGKTIVSWPQLGGAALINGSAVAYCVRKILNNQPIENNRALISLDEKLTPNYNSSEEVEKRRGIAENFKKILSESVYAPSGENCQPWKFVADGSNIHIFNVPEADTSLYNFEQKGSYVAHGALIENIVIVALKYGYKASVKLFPIKEDPNLVATLVLDPTNPRELPSYQYIAKRCTNRKDHAHKKIQEEQKKQLIETARETGLGELIITDNDESLNILGKAIAVNEQIIFENKKLHNFFYGHILWNEEDQGKAGGFYIKTLEFLPHQLKGVKLFKNWLILKLLNKIGKVSRMIAKENAEKYANSGALAIVVAKGNSREDFVNAGRTAERVWLKAVELGLSVHPCTGVIYFMERINGGDADVFSQSHLENIKTAYADITQTFGVEGKTIPMLFRLGYADAPSARSLRMKPNILFMDEIK